MSTRVIIVSILIAAVLIRFGAPLIDLTGFMPHGHCYLWQPGMVALQAIPDGFIFIAYVTISVTLVVLRSRRADLPFDWVFLAFGAFIVLCGITHLMEVFTLWWPLYWLSGGIKAVTAAVSVTVAILLLRLFPAIMAVPSPALLREANDRLEQALAEREASEAARLELVQARERAVAEAEMREEIIRAQNLRLAEMSMPVLPIMPGIAVIPIIGTMDATRCDDLSAVLDAVRRLPAHIVILDVTGLTHFDTAAVKHINDIAQAIGYLGAEAILTGVRTEMAMTMVHLGTEFEFRTKPTLLDGVRTAMQLRRTP